MSSTPATTAAALASANVGFDHLFANDISGAREALSKSDSPFHLLGLGVSGFLEAALGMETGLMAEAARLLAASEAGARKARDAEAKRVKDAARTAKPGTIIRDGAGRFAAGLEYEILSADAVVMLGLTHALSESYMGYLQCMYSLNAAHSKFTKLYKTVFPTGLDGYHTPSPSRRSSVSNLSTAGDIAASVSTLSVTDSSSSSPGASASASTATLSTSGPSASASASTSTSTSTSSLAPAPPTITRSLFGRWGASSVSLNTPAVSKAEQREREEIEKLERTRPPQNTVEEFVVSGTAFGFGLFNLVFSLLPKKVQSLVGLFGFKHDRELALRALAVSAGVSVLDGTDVAGGYNEGRERDVHGVFAGLVLMTFHGVVLLMAGYQADEAKTLRVYRAIVDSIEARYPTGALWILNRAKILRMSNDADAAIAVLQKGLEVGPEPDKPRFVQADTLLVFELAWTLLAQRRYAEAATAFVKLTELNSWSHATYYFIAAGCYGALGDKAKAQELYDALPELLGSKGKKVGGKDLPTEVLIRKKLEFYKEKQKRRGGDPAKFGEVVCISSADELGIFWNTHQRIGDDIAEAHIKELAALTPPIALVGATSPYLAAVSDGHAGGANASHPDIDTPDESALRALLLGILHRTLRLWEPARVLLEVARDTQAKVSTWIAGVANFELAVLELKWAQAEAEEKGDTNDKSIWAWRLAGADAHLDAAQVFAGKNEIDLSSRLDSRIALLRDEIAKKKAVVR